MKRRLLAALLCSLAVRTAHAATCSPTTFIKAQEFAAGPSPQIVITADFNHDGLPDVAEGDNSGVAILLNDGSGGFDAPKTTDLSSYVSFMVAGYFNGDANLDLAVVRFSSTVQILLGNGDGTFTLGDGYPSDYGVQGLVTADFNHDGIPDLALTLQYGGEFYVFLGNGDGTFQSPVVSMTQNSVAFITAADFNGDGFADVAASVNGGTIAIYRGIGDGSFASPTSIQIGGGIGPLMAVDLAGNGTQDLAASVDNYVAVIRGNGDGTFQAAVEYPIGYQAGALAAADINGDGRLDLAALRPANFSYGAGAVSVLFQRLDGFFDDGGSYDVGPGAQSLASADFDGDGGSDLVTANVGFQTVSVLPTIGDGNLRATLRVPLPGPPNGNPTAIVVADFGADIRPDIAVLAPGSASIDVLARDENDRFHLLATTPLTGSPSNMAAGHFTPSTHADLVVTDYFNGFEVFLGHGDGTFDAPTAYAAGGSFSLVTVADFNGDGKDDVILAGTQPTEHLAVFLGQGDGTFVPGPSADLVIPPSSLLATDVDGDGRIDIVTTNGNYDNSVSVYRGFRTGFFPPVQYPAGPGPVSAAAGFFASTQRIALAVADSGSTTVAILPSDGFQGFDPPILIGVGSVPSVVVAADFDGDGHDDFATANSSTSNVSLLLGTGAYAFQSPQIFPVEQNPQTLAVGALSGSLPDIVVANVYYSNALSVLENAGLSGTLTQPPVTLVNTPLSIAVFASGFGSLSYQWRQGGVALSDGGRFSGTTTPVLTIDPVTFPDTAAGYDVLVTDGCTAVVIAAPPFPVEFADVPTSSIFHADIVKIATAGVTAGCGGSDYCPTGLVSRAQMAVFLLKSEHGSAYTPPACTGIFADVPCPGPFADWIEQLFHEGVTAGCGGGDYCPDASVTRAQMAVFLLKTVEGSAYVPPPATAIFGDVPVDAFAADFIDDLYNQGIAGGCSSQPLLYCPGNPVNRAQMAALLVNAFPGL